MTTFKRTACLLAAIGIFLPLLGQAQVAAEGSLATNLAGLQGTLNTVLHTMLGKCGELVGVGQSLAGFGALWYIAYRVWGHLARAEEIDFFPLLRPFAIGVALAVYPGVVDVMNKVLEPTVDGTNALVTDSNQSLASLLAQKQAILQQGAEWQMYVGPDGNGSLEKWAQYTGNTDNGIGSGFGMLNWAKFEMSKAAYNIKNSFKVVLSECLETLYEAAALCINTARIFYLVVLAIVGPLVFGLSVFDGFHHVLVAWLARYIHIFLWLPVANIFGSIIGQIQQEMVKIDIAQLNASGQTWFGPTDAAYLVFLLMGIVGYFTVPSVTQHIISVFPVGGAHLTKISNASEKTATSVVSTSVQMAAQAPAAAAGLFL
jgi:conjugative transposon TraJ protein